MKAGSKFMLFGAALVVAGFLAACTSDGRAALAITETKGPPVVGKALEDAGDVLTAVGGGPFGTILKAIGGLLILGGGAHVVAKSAANKVSDEKIAKYDAASENVAFASDGSQVPLAAPAKPVEAPKV